MKLVIELELDTLTYESESFGEELIAGFKVQEVLSTVANKINGRSMARPDVTDAGRIGPWPRPWDTERIGTWRLEP